jgi:hypothetical protein
MKDNKKVVCERMRSKKIIAKGGGKKWFFWIPADLNGLEVM